MTIISAIPHTLRFLIKVLFVFGYFVTSSANDNVYPPSDYFISGTNIRLTDKDVYFKLEAYDPFITNGIHAFVYSNPDGRFNMWSDRNAQRSDLNPYPDQLWRFIPNDGSTFKISNKLQEDTNHLPFIYANGDGRFGVWKDDFSDQHWELIESDVEGYFQLKTQAPNNMKLYSNHDGRFGAFNGQNWQDQYWTILFVDKFGLPHHGIYRKQPFAMQP
jgi:hypothetical protein